MKNYKVTVQVVFVHYIDDMDNEQQALELVKDMFYTDHRIELDDSEIISIEEDK